MNWNNYECDGQMSIFDLAEATETIFNPLEALALCGTGFHDGMKRVLQYFTENHSIKEKVSFLKKEYGIGGFGSPVKKSCIIHEMCTYSHGKDIAFAYYDENLNNVETSCTWEQLAKTITEMGLQYLYIDECIANRCEVIGNIFDNADLLKGE